VAWPLAASEPALEALPQLRILEVAGSPLERQSVRRPAAASDPLAAT
jgi:hypothetical protein